MQIIISSESMLAEDPDVLWIVLRTALREGRLAEAADAQRRLAAIGISIRIHGLDVRPADPVEAS